MSATVGMKWRRRDAYFRKLRQLAPQAEQEMGKAAIRSAEEMAAKARQFAPRRTGELADSIVATPGGQHTPPYSQPGGSFPVPEHAAAVTAGNTEVRYPHLVEYGTRHAPAQPFFWPAYRLLVRRMRSRFSRALNKSIRDVARK